MQSILLSEALLSMMPTELGLARVLRLNEVPQVG
jgi:hypothetical protein